MRGRPLPPPPRRTRAAAGHGAHPFHALLTAAVAALLLPVAASGQASGELPATPEAAVKELFDGMRAADSARVRRLFEPGTALARPAESEDGVTVERVPIDRFLSAVGGAEPGQLDERIRGLEVRRDGRLATAWMEYAFFLDGELHHCGVDAFQLYRSEQGWKVFGLADTSRTEGCREEWPER